MQFYAEDMIAELIRTVLWSLASNVLLLILAWIIFVVLGAVWSGLRNLGAILMFPGTLLHIATHALVGQIFGLNLRVFNWINSYGRERLVITFTTNRGEIISLPRGILLSLSPALTSIPISALFFQMAKLLPQFDILLLWFGVSTAIAGSPSTDDLRNIMLLGIASEPLSIFFYVLTPVIFALNAYAWGIDIAVLLVITYFFSIMILSALAFGKESEVLVQSEV